MLSGLRAGVLCGLAMAGPGGPGTLHQAAPQVHSPAARPARAAPPLAVALAPPSHPDRDVKGPATERGTRSPRFLGNGGGERDVFVCSYVMTLLFVPRSGAGERRGRCSANPRGEWYLLSAVCHISTGLTTFVDEKLSYNIYGVLRGHTALKWLRANSLGLP